MTKCICGSDVLLHVGGKTYCAGCFHAGIDFASSEIVKMFGKKEAEAKNLSFEIRR